MMVASSVARRTLLFVLLLASTAALASLPLQATLEELAKGADHILVGRIVGVDMIDANGRPITDKDRRTGPGLKDRIRLLIVVDEVLVTNAPSVPKRLAVPLDPFMHYRYGDVSDAHAQASSPELILLRGKDFMPVVAGVFRRDLKDRAEALRIHAATHASSPKKPTGEAK
ncbi:hypothetical protein [Arenimonas sp.]|uniref:hypothetical protein n=1 Tax=Arenimonas sp. TaxID=1872635 RepID=UPI0039E2CAE6